MPDLNFSGIADAPKNIDFSGIPDAAKPAASGWPATIADVGIGAAKRVMRAGQQIGNLPKMVGLPGLAEGTDKLFGLAPGTSWNASEPSNTAQRVGSTGTAIAASLAAASAIPDIPLSPQKMAPGINVTSVKTIGDVSSDAFGKALKGAYSEIVGKGPMSAEKAGQLAAKYGKKAALAALAGTGYAAFVKFVK